MSTDQKPDSSSVSKMGRPPIEIDWTEFKKLCYMQSTLEEIAGWFGCSVDTIENKCKQHFGETFSEVFKKQSAGGKVSLRRSMFQKANDGNTTMMIWLSKQHLGMSDKTELSGDQSQPILLKYNLDDLKKD